MNDNGRLVFFDLETTGSTPGLHKVIQFAGIAVDGRTLVPVEEVEYKVTLHFLDDKWDPEAMKGNVFARVTGFSIEEYRRLQQAGLGEAVRAYYIGCVERWNAQPGIKIKPQALALIDSFLNRHKSVPMVSKRNGSKYLVARLAGHNVHAFDIPHLRAWYDGKFFPAEYRSLDTFHLAAWASWMESGMDNVPLNMPALLEKYGIKGDGAHDALVDVRNNLELARRLLFKLTQFRMQDQEGWNQ